MYDGVILSLCRGLTTGSTSEQVVSLHWVLELVVVSKLVVELSGMFYWRICDSTGYCYVQLAYFQSFIFALSESLLFAVLLLVAKGAIASNEVNAYLHR